MVKAPYKLPDGNRELRDFMERQGDWALSTDGALCQANDGECTG